MLSVTYKPFMLSVVMLNDIILSVAAPIKTPNMNNNFLNLKFLNFNASF
jgi:hypothetical protein